MHIVLSPSVDLFPNVFPIWENDAIGTRQIWNDVKGIVTMKTLMIKTVCVWGYWGFSSGTIFPDNFWDEKGVDDNTILSHGKDILDKIRLVSLRNCVKHGDRILHRFVFLKLDQNKELDAQTLQNLFTNWYRSPASNEKNAFWEAFVELLLLSAVLKR